jgi:hypothetical protein
MPRSAPKVVDYAEHLNIPRDDSGEIGRIATALEGFWENRNGVDLLEIHFGHPNIDPSAVARAIEGAGLIAWEGRSVDDF